jgi:hypothetical protein
VHFAASRFRGFIGSTFGGDDSGISCNQSPHKSRTYFGPQHTGRNRLSGRCHSPPRVNRRVPCADTHRPNGFPIHFMCNGKALLRLYNLTKIMFRKFTSSFSRGVQVPSGNGSSGSYTWPFPRGMDKKTGPRYLPRLNILGCFTLVHAFRTGKPRKLACAMTLPTHTGL